MIDKGKLIQQQLTRQEFGGDVPDERFVPTDNVRSSPNSPIKSANTFKKVQNAKQAAIHRHRKA